MKNWISADTLYRVERVLWAAVLVALPVTSFRYLPFMGRDTQVKPLSLIPAALLLVVLLVHSLRERRLLLWNNHFQPLLVFILIAVATSAVGFLLMPLSLNSYTYPARMMRGWVSLAVGLVFLIGTVAMSRDEQSLKFTLRWLYVGFFIQTAWSLVQFVQIFVYHFPGLDLLQKAVMMTGLATNRRINGLTLEPSWLAAQVITLYLPWALAAVLKNYDMGFSRKWLIPILASCLFLLVFTYSRSGILITLVAVTLTCILAGWDSLRRAWRWFLSPWQGRSDGVRRPLDMAVRLAVLLAIFVSLAGGTFVLSRNQYFAKILETDKSSFIRYLVDISAGPRLAYSWAGWSIFSEHPWTGVGLGGAGFYIIPALPDFAHVNITETALLLSPDNQIYPGIHNLYVRLLAETGIGGFWAFMAFYLLCLSRIFNNLGSTRKLLVFLGAASLMAWLSIVMLGITQDSFALPIIWIPLGILIGMSAAENESAERERTPSL